jgi:hypothetical protein
MELSGLEGNHVYDVASQGQQVVAISMARVPLKVSKWFPCFFYVGFAQVGSSMPRLALRDLKWDIPSPDLPVGELVDSYS